MLVVAYAESILRQFLPSSRWSSSEEGVKYACGSLCQVDVSRKLGLAATVHPNSYDLNLSLHHPRFSQEVSLCMPDSLVCGNRIVSMQLLYHSYHID